MLKKLITTLLCAVTTSGVASANEHAWQQTLRDAGWEAGAARQVVDLNAEWFGILAQEYPRELARQQAVLASLGEFPALMPFIRQHPETVSLLAMA